MRASRDGTSAMHSAEAADAELAERGRGLAGRVLAESARAGLGREHGCPPNGGWPTSSA